VRPTDITELIPEIGLMCPCSVPAVTVNITITLNADVTSRTSPSPEAVLLIDEALERVPGVNLIQADRSGTTSKQIRFPNVALPASTDANSRQLRIANIRGNASTIRLVDSAEFAATVLE